MTGADVVDISEDGISENLNHVFSSYGRKYRRDLLLAQEVTESGDRIF